MRILRLPEVLNRTGLSRTTIWRLMRAGQFPASVQITAALTGWYEDEIVAWVEARPRRTQPTEAAREA